MILIVVIECIVSILLIAVIGKAMESYFYEVGAQEIYFTTFSNDAMPVLQEGEADTYSRTEDGRIILRPGMLYKEKENSVEELPNAEYSYEGALDDIIVEFVNHEDVTLRYIIFPLNTADKVVTFSCQDPEIEIDATGRVHFLGAEIRPAQITIMTKNGKTATIILKQRKSSKPISALD